MNHLSRRQKWGGKRPEKRRLANLRVSVGVETCVHPVQSRPARHRLLLPVNPVKPPSAAKVERREANASFLTFTKFFIACGITSLHQNLHHHLLHGNSNSALRPWIPTSDSVARAVSTFIPTQIHLLSWCVSAKLPFICSAFRLIKLGRLFYSWFRISPWAAQPPSHNRTELHFSVPLVSISPVSLALAAAPDIGTKVKDTSTDFRLALHLDKTQGWDQCPPDLCASDHSILWDWRAPNYSSSASK